MPFLHGYYATTTNTWNVLIPQMLSILFLLQRKLSVMPKEKRDSITAWTQEAEYTLSAPPPRLWESIARTNEDNGPTFEDESSEGWTTPRHDHPGTINGSTLKRQRCG